MTSRGVSNRCVRRIKLICRAQRGERVFSPGYCPRRDSHMSQGGLNERVSVLMGALIKARGAGQFCQVYNHRRWEWFVRDDGSLNIQRGRGVVSVAASLIPTDDTPDERARLYCRLQQVVRDLSRCVYLRFCLSHVARYELPVCTRRLAE